MVMGDDSCLRGCGFESLHCILDGHDIFHIDLFVCKDRKKQKEARVGPVKKGCIKRKTMKKETSHFYSEKSNSFQLTVLSE